MILNVNANVLKISFWLGVLFSCHPVTAAELSGYLAGEYRYFQHESAYEQASQHQASFVVAPEFYVEWAEGDQSLLFSPFLRIDGEDDERTHADIRELQWLLVNDDWELRAGIGKVFWGVTESQHLVDVINQTDLVENSDTEDKLGQPMINLSLFKEWGTLDLFVLPYFRERTFAGENGRLRSGLIVDTDNALYESGAKQHHVDFAVRWSQTLGDWDVGLSHFYGTNREPLFQLNSTMDRLRPFYEIMHQTGLDIQKTSEAWLWKLEVIRRETRTETFTALTGGFEYTFYGVMESNIDVGVIAEYLFDDRNDQLATPFEDDVLLGTRITWNDEQSTELLVGIIQDMTSSDYSWNIEANRRVGGRWKASLEGRFFHSTNTQSALSSINDDDYIQLELSMYF
jgi:hypothetical protein